MAGFSYPFDDGPGASITEDQWSHMMRDAVGTGVHETNPSSAPLGNGLEVFSIEEPGIVRVRPGRATIDGFHYQQSGTEILAVAQNAHATQSRIDMVLLRLDLDTNEIALEVRQGANASSPVPPTVGVNELALATFRVRPNTSTILAEEVEDERVFIGRRVQLAHRAHVGNTGDIGYDSFGGRWYGVRPDGIPEAFSHRSELDAHIAAADPHPQYMTLPESTPTVITSTVTASPLVTIHATYHRALMFPGGFGIAHLYLFATFNGADNPGAFTLATISNPALRPNFSFRIVGHQWKFANSTDDWPLVGIINPTGSIQAGESPYLMGEARLLFNLTYFLGPGV